jgi:hypothetical protein
MAEHEGVYITRSQPLRRTESNKTAETLGVCMLMILLTNVDVGKIEATTSYERESLTIVLEIRQISQIFTLSSRMYQ